MNSIIDNMPIKVNNMPIACIKVTEMFKNIEDNKRVIGLPRSKIEVAVVTLTYFRPVYHVIT